MNSLRHFTIRRVVLWIMIVSLGVVALAGGYSSQIVRDIYRQTDRSAVLTQQLSFLTHSALVMQAGTAADKNALVALTPASADWDSFRAALTTSPSEYATVTRAKLDSVTQQLAQNQVVLNADRRQLERILLAALLAAFALLLFCDRYLVVHLVRPVGKIRGHLKIIAGGDLTREPEDLGRNCVGQLVPLVKEMQHSLLQTVSAIHDNAAILHREAGDIAAGNADLSDRTSTQAAALEQTAASMEERSRLPCVIMHRMPVKRVNWPPAPRIRPIRAWSWFSGCRQPSPASRRDQRKSGSSPPPSMASHFRPIFWRSTPP